MWCEVHQRHWSYCLEQQRNDARLQNQELQKEVERLRGPFTCGHDPKYAGGACAVCHAKALTYHTGDSAKNCQSYKDLQEANRLIDEMEKDYEIARRALSYILHGAKNDVDMYAAANDAMAKMRPSGGFAQADDMEEREAELDEREDDDLQDTERPVALCPKCGMRDHGGGGDCTLKRKYERGDDVSDDAMMG